LRVPSATGPGDSGGCAQPSKIDLAEADRQALTAIVADRNSPQKRVWRTQIVLLTAGRCGTMALTCRAGINKTEAR
jgi:hypothetical protein